MNMVRLTNVINDALRNIYDNVEPEDAEEIVECIAEAFPGVVSAPLEGDDA